MLKYIISICLFSTVLSFSLLTKGHDWGDDFSAYIMQAKSVVEGTKEEFIERNRFTIENSSSVLGPTMYPWGFPILIAPVYYFFGLNIVAFKYVNLAFFQLFLISIFYLFKNHISLIDRFILVLLFAFSPIFLTFHDSISSDIPFLFFSTLSVLLIGKLIVYDEKLPYLNLTGGWILLGVTIFISFLINPFFLQALSLITLHF